MSRIEAADRPMSAEEHHPTNGEERRSTGTEHTDAAEPASVDTDDPAGNGSMRTDDPTASGAVRADEPTGASRADSAAARLGADKMASRSDEGDAPEALIPANRSADYRARWDVVKGQFVDDPRSAVQGANTMVGEILDELEELFRRQRSELEQGLNDEETSTEDLRLAMRRYRSFFDRLLSF